MRQSADRPVIGLAMIVRDANDTVGACLESLWPHVDHVAVLDTGSKDSTPEFIQRLAPKHKAPLHLGRFEWVSDFGAARIAAEQLLPPEVDWIVWADADDTVRGAENLRELAAQAPADVAAFGFDYDYAQDQHGNTVCRLKRERLVRRGHGQWHGRVHEAQAINGRIEWMPAAAGEWVHGKPPAEGETSNQRNLKILRSWIKDDPTNTRLLAYLGTEEAGTGNLKAAARYFKRYTRQDTVWPEERAQVHRKLALIHFEQGKISEGIDLALQALRVHPEWPDSYLTLAEGHYRLREYQHAESWARRVLELGAPADTLLIVNPLDYTFQPRLVLAGALGEQGRLDEALQVAGEALALVPDDPRVVPAARSWRTRLKRDQTAAGVLAHAQTLITHDEQAKALDLLERSVPYFCVDHPDVVAMRSQLRERLLIAHDPAVYDEHYKTGGSKPEDFTSDDRALELAAHLPRARFLLAGLAEQAAA